MLQYINVATLHTCNEKIWLNFCVKINNYFKLLDNYTNNYFKYHEILANLEM